MSQEFAPRRAVILGASNVRRNLSVVVETAQRAWGQPLDLLIAAGHGRSYGAWNWVVGYSVPGIERCGLWSDLAARPAAPTAAMLTDVGNDLLYGATPPMILAWIETCLERLVTQCERIVITELPLENVAALAPWKFALLRSVLFPTSRITFSETIAHARELNAGLLQLAARYRCQTVQPQSGWFGFDPIHIRRSRALSAWQTFFDPWRAAAQPLIASGSIAHWIKLRRVAVHEQRWFGHEHHQAQPAVRYPDGSSVALY